MLNYLNDWSFWVKRTCVSRETARDLSKNTKVKNILDQLFLYVKEKQYFYMIFEESEKIV